MPDYRMNKSKPIGKTTLSSIANYNVASREAATPKPKSPEKPVFEITPTLQDDPPRSAEEALGVAITPTTPITTSGDGIIKQGIEGPVDDGKERTTELGTNTGKTIAEVSVVTMGPVGEASDDIPTKPKTKSSKVVKTKTKIAKDKTDDNTKSEEPK